MKPTVAREALERPHRFCATATCPVVYYRNDGELIGKDQITVRVGIKEPAPRLVCYCFGHTVEDIHDQILHTGETDVLDAITTKVKAGLCACEAMNPEGVCCLGRVRAAVKEGLACHTVKSAGAMDEPEEHDCCSPQQGIEEVSAT